MVMAEGKGGCWLEVGKVWGGRGRKETLLRAVGECCADDVLLSCALETCMVL